MAFSERAGIAPQTTTRPSIARDAPLPFRKAAIKAAVDAIGWDYLRPLAIDSCRGDLPDSMIRWGHIWDDSDIALMDCPWWMFFDIIEAVSLRKRRNVVMPDIWTRDTFGLPMLRKPEERFKVRDRLMRASQEFDQRINILFRFHNLAYSLHDNEIVPDNLAEVHQHLSKAIPAAKPSEQERLKEAWDALNSRPEPKPKLAVEAMRNVFDNLRNESWLIKHIDHREQSHNEVKPMAWHLAEVAHHTYRAACKPVHDEDNPTQAEAMLSVMLGASLVVYRNALAKQA